MKQIPMLLAASFFALQLSAQTNKEVAPPPPPPPPPAFQKAPPPPPVEPPPPPKVTQVRFTPPMIVNDKGYALSVTRIKKVETVIVRNKSAKVMIALSDWNKRRSFYEKKYGVLPPPPPPPPAPPVREL